MPDEKKFTYVLMFFYLTKHLKLALQTGCLPSCLSVSVSKYKPRLKSNN